MPSLIFAARAVVGLVAYQTNQLWFNANGTGFIPGLEDQTPPIPSTTFTYSVVDATHLKLIVNGRPIVIEVKVEGDQLTWDVDPAHNVQNIYTRAR